MHGTYSFKLVQVIYWSSYKKSDHKIFSIKVKKRWFVLRVLKHLEPPHQVFCQYLPKAIKVHVFTLKFDSYPTAST
jgi:hypothetical protein